MELDPEGVPLAHHELQRLLGRCLLRLQQYELLLKDLLTHCALGGPLDELEDQLQRRADKFARMTLGQLASEFFDEVVVSPGKQLPDTFDADRAPKDRISLGFRYSVETESHHRETLIAAVKELVDMRNDLVHHLIQRFPIWEQDGCAAAQQHLEDCVRRIGEHLDELRHRFNELLTAREVHSSFVQSDDFMRLLDGISPDGSVDWSSAKIVHVLRDAASELAKEGWTPLPMAIEWMGRQAPGQTPGRYGCRSWQQVLSDSRAFDLAYRKDAEAKVAWYRPRG